MVVPEMVRLTKDQFIIEGDTEVLVWFVGSWHLASLILPMSTYTFEDNESSKDDGNLGKIN